MKKLSVIIFSLFMFVFPNIGLCNEITLTSTNHCSLNDRVTSSSMNKLKFCLAEKTILRRGRRYPIYLVINSPGGSVYAGLRFIEFAKTIKNVQTVTIFAASMASAIVEALPGDRHGVESAITMFHRAKGTFTGQFEDGEVESQLKLWKQIVRGMEKTNSKRIGITLKEYKKRILNEYWVYGRDNVKQNTLDRISTVKCSVTLLKGFREVRIRTFLGSYTKKVSNCPLIN